MSSEARSLILGRIRDTGVGTGAADESWEAIARGYVGEGALDRGARLALFVERLEHYQVGVRRCAADGVREAVAAVLQGRGMRRLIRPPAIDERWLPADLEFPRDEGFTHRELDESAGVLTGCWLAIAATGTLVLRHGPSEGRRALTLVPDYHLCVVLADQVVETVPEAFRRIAAERPALVTTISGPSATADIEMTRIRGVHGPRTLDVILAGS